MQKITCFILFVITCIFISAQEKSPVKFGKISADDFKTTVYSIDSNAAAVVIADIGFSYFEGNEKEWFSFYHKRQKRVHILNKNGYDAANVEVYLYSDGGDEQELNSLKATTYNFENGKVVETKLDNKSVFKEKLDRNWVIKKFTMPNVKEGTIIEFSYTVKSDFLRSPTPWYFQGDYPVLWSDLEFHIPEFFNYVFITEGYHRYHQKQPPSSVTNTFNVNVDRQVELGSVRSVKERLSIKAQVVTHRWVMKDVPALKTESFTSSIRNHISKIEFQLSEYRPPLQYLPIMQTWPMLTKALLESDYFGAQIGKGNGWLDEDVRKITAGLKSDAEKAMRIYEFLRDNFTCTDHSSISMDELLKNILKTRKGNVAEINLLLVAMLKNAGIDSDPVMLSTRSHGFTYALYPLLNKFNYVIATTVLDGKRIFLDATRPMMGFGKLLSVCYNGHARIVNKEATPLEFTTDSLRERKLTSLFISNGDKGEIIGSMQQTPGYYESYALRDKVKEKGIDDLIKNIKKDFGSEVDISNPKIDSLDKLDESIQLQYDLKLNIEKEDIIYLNPMFGEGYKENPFKSAERTYPVEMPYTRDETYVLRMDVPEGYQLDELPKSIRVNFDEEGKSYFEYIIALSEGVVSLRSRIRLNRSYFLPDEYEYLREFYAMIVNKHNEQIVFKKKK